MKNTVNSFAQELKRTNTRVVFQLASNIPLAGIEAIELEEVATCILENSLQGMPTGGKITIATAFKKDEQAVSVEIKDEGVGIPRENISRVFEPFFTTKQARADQSAGLGLSIVYSIIKECKGEVTIKSSLGHGTQVKITLPIFKNHNHHKRN